MRLLVIGLGKSGVAARDLLEKEGSEVVGFDDKLGCDVPSFHVKDFDRIVLSPGVSPTHPLVEEASRLGIPVIGEAELALQKLHQRAIAITGTNGKTTVTLLITHVLNVAGYSAYALGNVGAPLSSYVMEAKRDDIAVVELSSFQLDTLRAKCFDVGLILNITPDHLDRYPSMTAYAESKLRLGRCLRPSGKLWIHEDVVNDFQGLIKDAYETFGQNPGCTLSINQVAFLRNSEFFNSLGKHDCENILAAWIACREFVTEDVFIKAVQSFKKPSHRIEWVASVDGVEYVNDSKGTNIDATIKAVDAMKRPVVLIAGGVDKGASYEVWKKSFAKKVRQVVAIGQASEKIARDLKPDYEVSILPNLSEAVLYCKKMARSGDVILLSPGCSSYDMFRDYAQRGDEFKRLVYLLQEKKG